MQIAPSRNPEKESKQFSALGLVFAVGSLLFWFLGIAGLAFSVRGLILANRVNNPKQRLLSIVGFVLSILAIGYYLAS